MNKESTTGTGDQFWNWALNLRFYLRKWLYHRYLGPIVGPLILFFLAILYAYLFVAVFYLFIVRWKIPPIPVTTLNLIFQYYGIVKGFLIAHWLILGVVGIVVSYAIHLLRIFRLPRNRSKKICIGIAFSLDFVDSKNVRDVLKKRSNIKAELHKLLEEKNLTKDFKIKILNDFHANAIHRNVALGSKFNSDLLKKTRIPFIIYGFVKKAPYSSQQQYKYELNYIVSHPPIPWLHSLRLAKDFTRLLKKQNWIFPESDSGTMIEVVADNIRQDAMFAIGTSAVVGGQPIAGKSFLDELLATPKLQPGFKIRIREYQSLCFYSLSALSLRVNDIPGAIRNMQEAIRLKDNSYDYYLNLSYLRWLNNEFDEGLRAIDLAERYQANSIWRFNKAFLLMCKGTTQDIQNAVGAYRSMNASKLSQIPINSYGQIIETLEEEAGSGKDQFLYGLIFVYAKVKKDKSTASSYLQLLEEKFANNNSYQFLIDDAKKLLL